MGKIAATKLTVDLVTPKPNGDGTFRFTDYIHHLTDSNENLSPDPNNSVINGENVQRFTASEKKGGKWHLIILPASLPGAMTSLPTPTKFSLSFTGLRKLASPLVQATVQPTQKNHGWSYVFDFKDPTQNDTDDLYEWTLLVNFSNGVADRTYRIDPEMDCSDTGFDPFGDGEERRAKKE